MHWHPKLAPPARLPRRPHAVPFAAAGSFRGEPRSTRLALRSDRAGSASNMSVDAAAGLGYPWRMSAQAQAILEQALRLSADERADLAHALQRSLEDGASNLPPEEVARLWNEEIERRLARARERVARGEPTGRNADEVYADAEAKLQSIRVSRGG